jgi:D-serine deaminase-like pyridoxal phosphate-dependent protein
VTDSNSEAARHELAARLGKAVEALPEPPATPAYVVDLDGFDANADDLVRRAAGTPIRVATKSVRVPALIHRALDHDGFQGVLAYNLREALWLLAEGITDDIVLGYPVADPGALRALLEHPTATEHITLMVDDVAQLDLVDNARGGTKHVVRLAIDVDASLRVGRGRLGIRRSPLFDVADVTALARAIVSRPGFSLVGVMTYEGQVAGLQDDLPTAAGRARSLMIRQLKSMSVRQLDERRREIAAALRTLVELEFWNSGGSGSIETSCTPPVTEVTAGSGLLVSTIFDHYRAFEPRPAAFFGLRVSRRPSPDSVVVSGGGFIASGPSGKDRSPVAWAPPGLQLTGLEGAGEVQTPLVGKTAASLAIGDWVWFRHAKAGELAEHTHVVHLLNGSSIEATVPTYRGAGQTW